MAATNLLGPHRLTKSGIDGAVTKTSPGAYTLGRVKEDTFYVNYVGRSDDDLNRRLHDHEGKYDHFKYGYYPTKRAAYEKECTLYHDFANLDNEVHPAKPSSASYGCPVGNCKN